MELSTLIPIVVSGLALIGVIYTGRAQNKKAVAEAGKLETDTQGSLVNQAIDVAALEKELRESIQAQFDAYREAAEARAEAQDQKIEALNSRIELLAKARDSRDEEIEKLKLEVQSHLKRIRDLEQGEIVALKAELEKHVLRIQLLEDWVRAQGADPDQIVSLPKQSDISKLE